MVLRHHHDRAAARHNGVTDRAIGTVGSRRWLPAFGCQARHSAFCDRAPTK